MWFVYILQCNDSSYYVGSSEDVESRVKRHNSGRGSRYTKLRRPVVLVYTEIFDSADEAKKRELEIKDFSVKNKEQLVKYGDGKRFPSPQVD